MDMTKLGQFLQALRKEQGLTQEQLGQEIGVSGKTISRWETGTYMPPVDALLTLSERYGVTINELLSGQRIAPAEQAAKADETLAAVLRENAAFTLKERQSYWQDKWLREHRVAFILYMLTMAALLLIALLQDSAAPAALAVCAIASTVFVAAMNNARAGYVEHHLYDEALADRREP